MLPWLCLKRAIVPALNTALHVAPLLAMTLELQLYDDTVTDTYVPLKISTCLTVQCDLLAGWRPHPAEEGDIICMWRSGGDPEVLQMHSGFSQAALADFNRGRPHHI